MDINYFLAPAGLFGAPGIFYPIFVAAMVLGYWAGKKVEKKSPLVIGGLVFYCSFVVWSMFMVIQVPGAADSQESVVIGFQLKEHIAQFVAQDVALRDFGWTEKSSRLLSLHYNDVSALWTSNSILASKLVGIITYCGMVWLIAVGLSQIKVPFLKIFGGS